MQVASKTLENIAAISDVVTLPILRPLIGMDKDEIIEQSRKIDTFKISTEPYDDCCSYMVPQKPETRAKPLEVHAVEEKVNNWENMIDQAIMEAEVIKIKFPKDDK